MAISFIFGCMSKYLSISDVKLSTLLAERFRGLKPSPFKALKRLLNQKTCTITLTSPPSHRLLRPFYDLTGLSRLQSFLQFGCRVQALRFARKKTSASTLLFHGSVTV